VGGCAAVGSELRDLSLYRPLSPSPPGGLPSSDSAQVKATDAGGEEEKGRGGGGDGCVSGSPPSCPFRLPPFSHALGYTKVGGGGRILNNEVG
jgi:hypothetical protein